VAESWLAGVVVVVMEGGAAPAPRHSRREALLQFERLRKARGAQQAVRHCGGRPGRDG
jgi:hypothetical protein